MAFLITKPLEEHIKEATLAVNKLASDKILAKYPLYRQLNVIRTSDAEIMNAWIDNIRALAQTAKASISTAPSIVEIRSVTALFVDNLQLI